MIISKLRWPNGKAAAYEAEDCRIETYSECTNFFFFKAQVKFSIKIKDYEIQLNLNYQLAFVAQSVERQTLNLAVEGSKPSGGSFFLFKNIINEYF